MTWKGFRQSGGRRQAKSKNRVDSEVRETQVYRTVQNVKNTGGTLSKKSSPFIGAGHQRQKPERLPPSTLLPETGNNSLKNF
jgi:hypothetical protein